MALQSLLISSIHDHTLNSFHCQPIFLLARFWILTFQIWPWEMMKGIAIIHRSKVTCSLLEDDLEITNIANLLHNHYSICNSEEAPRWGVVFCSNIEAEISGSCENQQPNDLCVNTCKSVGFTAPRRSHTLHNFRSIGCTRESLFSLPCNVSTNARANSKVVPGPRLVTSFPSATTRSSLYL